MRNKLDNLPKAIVLLKGKIRNLNLGYLAPESLLLTTGLLLPKY